MEYVCNLCFTTNSISDDALNWPRDLLNCLHCGSIVRDRSLYLALLVNCPNYKDLKIHQSSPSYKQALHVKLLNECNDYSYSQFFPNVSNGKYNEENILCADLSNLPFKDNSFDIFLTSDVFEHLWEPAKCLKEIYRVLKPNGIYLMVFPMDRGYHTTEQPVVKLNDETIIHKQTICGNWKGFVNSPEFHGNPADNSGSIVTYYWGYDVKKFIENNSNFKTEIYFKHDIVKFGIIGVMNEAVVCKKTELDSEYICDVSETKKQYYTISNQVSSD